MERKSCVSLDRVKPAFVFKDLPDTIPDPIISAESSHRHPVTTNMQTTKSGRRRIVDVSSHHWNLPTIFVPRVTFIFFADRRQEEEPMDWDDVPSLPEVSAPFVFPVPTEDEVPHLRSGYFVDVRGVPLHSRGCPEGLLKRAASRDQSSRPPSGVPRATLCIEQMTAADGLLNRRQEEEPMDWDDVPSLPERIVDVSSHHWNLPTIFVPRVTFIFFADCRQEEEAMDWDDVPSLPEVSAPFVPSRPPRKMRSLISVQVSEPPSLSANRFPNMRALVPKIAAKKRNPWTGTTSLPSLSQPLPQHKGSRSEEDRRRFESSLEFTNDFRSTSNVYFLCRLFYRREGVFPYTPGAALRCAEEGSLEGPK
ncbi:hypothetical protein TNCV_2548801 [Trichonephila clavipes]|nr:hypothetical protein TNCV_2548801 [Trichonephila clavipes]